MKKQSLAKLPPTGSPIPDLSLSKPDQIQLDTPTQILSPEQLEEISSYKDRPTVLCEKFTQHLTLVSNPKVDLRAKIERDFLLFAYFWATKQGMEIQNISIFLGLIHELYHSISAEEASRETLILELENKMRGGGVEGYAGGMSGFTETELKSILEFVSISLLQHFELYSYVLTEKRETTEFKQEIGIEKLPESSTLKIPPLEESVPISFFQTLINPHPTTVQKTEIFQAFDTAQQVSSEVDAIKEKFSPEKVKKIVNIVTDKIVREFSEEMLGRFSAKENEFQARIKKIENKLKK